MIRSKFLSASLVALGLGLSFMSHSAQAKVSQHPVESQEVADFGEGNLIAQFGLGDILNVEDKIENRVNRFESSIRSRVPNILQPLKSKGK